MFLFLLSIECIWLYPLSSLFRMACWCLDWKEEYSLAGNFGEYLKFRLLWRFGSIYPNLNTAKYYFNINGSYHEWHFPFVTTVVDAKITKLRHCMTIPRAPEKVRIFISKVPIPSPNLMFDHLLESSHRDDSNKW